MTLPFDRSRASRTCGIALTGELGDHLLAPLGELGVAGLHLDHHAAVDAPEADHHQRRQQIERDALGRAGVHAGRAGDRLGAGRQQDRMIGVDEQRRAGVVGDADRQAPRRRASRMQVKVNGVVPLAAVAMRTSVASTPCSSMSSAARADVVLGALDGLRHRLVAAG